MDDRLIPSVNPPPARVEAAWWFVFAAHRMAVLEEGEITSIPFVRDLSDLGMRPVREWYLGTLAGCHCYCAEVSEIITVPEIMVLRGLRYLYGRLDESFHMAAMKASHMLEWDRISHYCGRCGAVMIRTKGMNAKECPDCGFLNFPRISPAVIVLVERENRVLLARLTRFSEELYSVIAGFVEPGETLEETVQREIEEEVGIRVKNICYFGSQPWPFPDSLMIGFTAEYESGEIKVDETEITDARWFEPDRLPTIPGRISIARRLIDWFVDKSLREKDKAAPKTERRYKPDE